MNIPRGEWLSLCLGEVDVASFATRHGLAPADVERLRAVFVEGLKAGVGRAPRVGRSWRLVLLSSLVASAAFAGLVVFQADTPALASEVNANFAQLQTWLEAKVGPVTSAGVTTSSVTATALTVNGTATVNGSLKPQLYLPQYASYNAMVPTGALGSTGGATIVNDNAGYNALMIVGNTAAGGARQVHVWDDLSVDRNLGVNGGVTIAGTGGNTLHACVARSATNASVVSCAAGEIAISGGGTCPWTGDSWQIKDSTPWNAATGFTPNGTQPDSWRTQCMVWGNAGSQVSPTLAYAICCRQ